MRRTGWILTATLLGLAGCGGAGASGPSASGPSDSDGLPGCSATDSIPQGASIELVLEDDVLEPDETARFRLVAPDADVLTGLPYELERWNGDRWVPAPRQPRAWTMQGFMIGSGGGTPTQSWPDQDATRIEPGRYRVVKSATYEGKRDIELVAHACFEVRDDA